MKHQHGKCKWMILCMVRIFYTFNNITFANIQFVSLIQHNSFNKNKNKNKSKNTAKKTSYIQTKGNTANYNILFVAAKM